MVHNKRLILIERLVLNDILIYTYLFIFSGGRSGIGGGGGSRSTISHQSSITSQIDVVEDRKALR